MYLKALSHIYIGLAHHDSSGTGHWPKGDTEGPLPVVTRGLLLDALRSAFRCSPPNRRYLVQKADTRTDKMPPYPPPRSRCTAGTCPIFLQQERAC